MAPGIMMMHPISEASSSGALHCSHATPTDTSMSVRRPSSQEETSTNYTTNSTPLRPLPELSSQQSAEATVLSNVAAMLKMPLAYLTTIYHNHVSNLKSPRLGITQSVSGDGVQGKVQAQHNEASSSAAMPFSTPQSHSSIYQPLYQTDEQTANVPTSSITATLPHQQQALTQVSDYDPFLDMLSDLSNIDYFSTDVIEDMQAQVDGQPGRHPRVGLARASSYHITLAGSTLEPAVRTDKSITEFARSTLIDMLDENTGLVDHGSVSTCHLYDWNHSTQTSGKYEDGYINNAKETEIAPGFTHDTHCREPPSSARSNSIQDIEICCSPYNKVTTNEASSKRKSQPDMPLIQSLKKTRRVFEDDERIETGLTRKAKACLRCRMYKLRCRPNGSDFGGICLTCLEVRRTIVNLPCLRYKISDSQLLDKGPHPRYSWTRRWTSMKVVDIKKWSSTEVKTLTVTQDVLGAGYVVQVRKFVPLPTDSLQRTWKRRGETMVHECAPYAIIDMKQAGQDISRFVDNNIGNFIEFYTNKDDKLMRSTYLMARKWSRIVGREEERSLLSSVLRLWVASRMESRSDRIVNGEVLNTSPQLCDDSAASYGNYLLPPVMQAQIELVTTATVLLPEKREVLRGLQALIEANRANAWFTIYLSMFILLHSCALLTRAESVRAQRQDPKLRYFKQQLVEEFHNGARTLLAHFHYCNKGSYPFSVDWTDPQFAAFAELDREQISFIRDTINQIQNRAATFERIKRDGVFEHDYYFICQLYESDWEPRHTV